MSGKDGCNAISGSSTASNIIHTGQSIHYSGKKFLSPVLETSNWVGNGKVTIEWVGESY